MYLYPSSDQGRVATSAAITLLVREHRVVPGLILQTDRTRFAALLNRFPHPDPKDTTLHVLLGPLYSGVRKFVSQLGHPGL